MRGFIWRFLVIQDKIPITPLPSKLMSGKVYASLWYDIKPTHCRGILSKQRIAVVCYRAIVYLIIIKNISSHEEIFF